MSHTTETDAPARKEWVRVSRAISGMTVTVTIQEANLSVKWAVKAYSGAIKRGVTEARAGAVSALEELAEAQAELEAVA